MLDFISVPLVVGMITLGIYKLFELFIHKKERLMLIEKLGDKLHVESLPIKFSSNLTQFNLPIIAGALKGGCLMLGIGVGLLVGFFICAIAIPGYTYRSDVFWNFQQVTSVVYGASVLVFGGLGLLISFFIELKLKKENQKQEEQLKTEIKSNNQQETI